MASHAAWTGVVSGWDGVLLGLLVSALSLASGRQDLGFRGGGGAFFWFFLALLATLGVIWFSLASRIWGGALAGAAVFCSEAWLIRRWWRAALARRQGQ